MKKLLLFVTMAASLLFTQCKKEESVSSAGKTVSMTVTAGPGSKTDITDAGAITWSTGDKLYVGDGSKYIGYLTIASGVGTPTGTFTGNVTLPTDTKDGEKSFGFFYLGSGELTLEDDATSVDVDFSSQDITKGTDGKLTNASKQHVGYGSATGTVVGNVVTDINVTMLSKVAIARFSFTKDADAYTGALKLSGDNVCNVMTVNFNSTEFACEGTKGEISLTNATSSEKYVMLVPTDETTGPQTLTFADANVSGSYTLANGIEANKFYGLTGAIAVTLEAAAPAHEYVDLGLPSGLLWATCNVGADSPEKYGDYFMWGSVTEGGDPDCSWANCPGNEGSPYYDETEIAAWDGSNLTDGVLKSDVDAAAKLWGDSWRMPTNVEWQELASNTYMKWEYNYAATGVSGFIVYKVKDDADRGLMTLYENYGSDPGWVTYDQDWNVAELTGEYSTSDAHLFLPAAGGRDGSDPYDAGSVGYYWSSSLYSFASSDAYHVYFDSGSVTPQSNYSRYVGYTVRPVCVAR